MENNISMFQASFISGLLQTSHCCVNVGVSVSNLCQNSLSVPERDTREVGAPLK